MNDVFETLQSMVLSTLRVSTPLIFAAMGGLMSERSGVINIALEGLMVAGAVTAAAVAYYTQSPWIGAGAAMAAGTMLALVYAFSVIQTKTDQIVAGTAINLLAFGIAPLATKALFDSTGHSPTLEMGARFQVEPVVGAFALVFFLHFWMKRTRWGLWHGFAGEHPEALSTAGISVRAVRWSSVAASGALAGLGGMALSIFLSSSFSRGMTAGRGFMAVAALIFGKWKPIPTMLACLFFGLTDALQIRMQGSTIFGVGPVPVQFIQVLPYAITLFVLAGFVGKSRSPSKLGTPWLLVAALAGSVSLSGCLPDSKKPAGQQTALTQEQGNVLLLREVFEVALLLRDPSKEELEARANTLLQGASLEGVYNGLIRSREYRDAETASGPASRAAIDAFSWTLASLQKLASEKAGEKADGTSVSPWRMPASITRPAAAAVRPTGIASGRQGSGWPEHDSLLKAKDWAALESFYREKFSSSSVYTLKRVLGEATLGLLEKSKTLEPDLSADLALLWNPRLKDAGAPSRLSMDRDFHLKWAQAASSDRIRWEALNRAHRIINEAQSGKSGE